MKLFLFLCVSGIVALGVFWHLEGEALRKRNSATSSSPLAEKCRTLEQHQDPIQEEELPEYADGIRSLIGGC